MATQVKHRRGTQSEIDAFTGAIGEIVVNTTEEELVLNNGATQGGIPIAKKKSTVLTFDTLSDVIANTALKVGYIVNLKERNTGKGGAASWEVVLASSVVISPNAPDVGDIVQCTGVPTLALKLIVGNVLTDRQIGLKGDGTDTSSQIQDWFTIGKNRGAAILEGTRGAVYSNIVDILTLPSGMTLYGNDCTFKSTDLTNGDIIQPESYTTIKKCVFIGGEVATVANQRKVRAIHILNDKVECRVENNRFLHFYITGVYTSGDRNNIPKNIWIKNNSFEGSNKQIQGITIFCGENVYIDKNTIEFMDSLPILVDEATNTTSMDNYGVLKNVHVTNNIINFDGPTNATVLYGIQVTSCETATITDNTIISPNVKIGRGIVATIYDLAQQKNRVENEGEVGPFLPIDEKKARLTISNNRVFNAFQGIYVGGYTAPVITSNNVVADICVYLLNIQSTISGVPYVFPSTDNTGLTGTLMEAMVNSNVLISQDVANEAVFISSQRNYFLDNVITGSFSQRYNATTQLSTHVVRDMDQSMGKSGTPILGSGISGSKILSGGEGATSISLVEGSSNLIERYLGYVPDDYIVVVQTSWNSGAYVPDSAKSNNSFQINFPTSAPGGGVLWWHIVHSESFRP